MESAHHAVEQVFPHPLHDTTIELGLMGASVAVAGAGYFLARYLYKARPELSERLAQTFAPIHRVLSNKYYVDELYGALFVRGAALGGGRALHGVDRFAIDGGDGEVRPGAGVNGIAWLTRDVVAVFSNAWDRYVVDKVVEAVAVVLDNLSYLFRAAQSGLVQQYALAMLIGLFLLFASGGLVLGLY